MTTIVPEYARMPGATAAFTPKGRLVLTLPEALVPVRKYSSVEVSRDASHWYFSARMHEDFTSARRGRHAWQKSTVDPAVGHRVRKLEVKPERLCGPAARFLREFGETADVEVSRTTFGYCIRVPFAALGKARQVRPFTKGQHDRNTSKMEGNTAMADNLENAQALAASAQSTRIVQCEFAGSPGKAYAYYTDDASIQAGDFVVVVSPYDGNFNSRGAHFDAELGGHPVVVKVVSVEETLESVQKVVKRIVQRVDLGDYRARQAAERRIAVLREKIIRAEKEARQRLELERLRDLSPELGTLLDELKSLGG